MKRLLLTVLASLSLLGSSYTYAAASASEKKPELETNAVRVIVTNYKQDDGLSSSDIIAISSGVIALLAFFATVWQAYLSRKHNKLSVKPFITHTLEYLKDSHFSLIIYNVGLGPAVIKQLHFVNPHTKERLNTSQLVNALSLHISGIKGQHRYTTYYQEHAVVPGASQEIFYFSGAGQSREYVESIANYFLNFELHVEYASMYGDKFIHSTNVDPEQ